jgi:hypothetical protein
MAKVSYANLKLKTKEEIKIVKHQDLEIEVLQYLPIESKNTLVKMTLQNAKDLQGEYDMIMLDMLFNVYLIYLYTNINFTEKQKENPSKIYDSFKSSGLLDEIILAIPESEYEEVFTYLEDSLEESTEYKRSLYGSVASLLNELTSNTQGALDAINQFDPSQFQNVLDFARSVNGGRNV